MALREEQANQLQDVPLDRPDRREDRVASYDRRRGAEHPEVRTQGTRTVRRGSRIRRFQPRAQQSAHHCAWGIPDSRLRARKASTSNSVRRRSRLSLPPSPLRTPYSAQGEIPDRPWPPFAEREPDAAGIHDHRLVEAANHLQVGVASHQDRHVESVEHRPQLLFGRRREDPVVVRVRRAVEHTILLSPSWSSSLGAKLCMNSRSAGERNFAHHSPISTSFRPTSSFGIGMSPRKAASQFPMTTGQPSSRIRASVSAGCGPTTTSPSRRAARLPRARARSGPRRARCGFRGCPRSVRRAPSCSSSHRYFAQVDRTSASMDRAWRGLRRDPGRDCPQPTDARLKQVLAAHHTNERGLRTSEPRGSPWIVIFPAVLSPPSRKSLSLPSPKTFPSLIQVACTVSNCRSMLATKQVKTRPGRSRRRQPDPREVPRPRGGSCGGGAKAHRASRARHGGLPVGCAPSGQRSPWRSDPYRKSSTLVGSAASSGSGGPARGRLACRRASGP